MTSFFTKNTAVKPAPPRQEVRRVFGLYTILLNIIFLTFGNLPATAQLHLRPVQPASDAISVSSRARVAAVQLPFFDDFSTSLNRLDPILWLPGGGTYVNNTSAINHPTRNVVTFDGLDRTGRPYSLGSSTAWQATDTLTSQPIDLSGIATQDTSLYFSFFWQRRGLGELPDGDDTLRLQFRNRAGNWVTVWRAPANAPTSTFTQTLLAINEPGFRHADFQFRFQSFGLASGPFDTWHIDYVYLNRGRNFNDRYYNDTAFRSSPSSFLRRYSAMPLQQYLARPAFETADSIKVQYTNLRQPTQFDQPELSFELRNVLTGAVIQTDNFPPAPNQGQTVSTKGARIRPAALTGQRAVLRAGFFLRTTDDDVKPPLPKLGLSRNDTISGLTVLDNYYAYDDGSAEVAINSSRAYTRFMVRFDATLADTVVALRLNMAPYLRDATNQQFVLAVMAATPDSLPGQVLHQQTVTLTYGPSRNSFVEFPLTANGGVGVKGTFFVGWTQVSEGIDGFAVGFDKNTPASASNFFVNVGSGWELGRTINADVVGVPMIRPVMGRLPKVVVTGTEEAIASLRVYPNPTRGLVMWDNPNLRQMDVFDAQGKLHLSIKPTKGQNQADVSQLSPGLYLLRLTDGKLTTTQKILKE